MIGANHAFQNYTSIEVGSTIDRWKEVLSEDQFRKLDIVWKNMLIDKKPCTHLIINQTRWTTPDLDGNGERQYTDTYLNTSMIPTLDKNGELSSVISCVTDVSELNWIEGKLRLRLDKAIQLQQEQEKRLKVIHLCSYTIAHIKSFLKSTTLSEAAAVDASKMKSDFLANVGESDHIISFR
jgi:hypothetical protein